MVRAAVGINIIGEGRQVNTVSTSYDDDGCSRVDMEYMYQGCKYGFLKGFILPVR